jgi:hypothetical protein
MSVSQAVKLCLFLALCLNSLTSMADVISGKIEFVKRPPFTGILYVANTGLKNKQPLVDQKDKAFTKKIAVGSPSNMMTFKNSDSLDHNIYANDRKHNVKFDVGLMVPKTSAEMVMDWQEESLVRIGCKIHPKMRGYVANVNTDYFHSFEFEKKVKNYEFTIEQVPNNKNTIVLLMPKYEKQVIQLALGETKTVVIKRKGKTKATLTISRN